MHWKHLFISYLWPCWSEFYRKKQPFKLFLDEATAQIWLLERTYIYFPSVNKLSFIDNSLPKGHQPWENNPTEKRGLQCTSFFSPRCGLHFLDENKKLKRTLSEANSTTHLCQKHFQGVWSPYLAPYTGLLLAASSHFPAGRYMSPGYLSPCAFSLALWWLHKGVAGPKCCAHLLAHFCMVCIFKLETPF